MQFVTKGPDIPDALLQAHEEGRVVFFCGAGISYPAGLPGFKGLVDNIYCLVGTSRTDIEQEAYARNQFDATLDLLERRLPGQRLAVRKALANALKPKLRRRGATDTHVALLQIARSREGALRLVTTNFDRIFETVAKRQKLAINAYAAPMLPIPKDSRWNGLVYLHGLLPEDADDSGLHRLVLTSGDFGLAYLTERWAARFVSELFRNYVVCFVGYSINDPVLRYMMDALAADRMLGEATPPAYTLGDCEPGREAEKTVEWEAKGVAPILYEVPAGSNDHSALHRTLSAWAETYREGIFGRERIVVDYAFARPSASTRQDDFVGRMLWALQHESGLPAKRFADFNPAPPLEWLQAFSENRFRHGDLDRFGVPARIQADDGLRFSFIRRPAPPTRAPWMSLISSDPRNNQWDQVMFHLARWLTRYLNDPALIIWVAERGGQLHDRWSSLIEHNLNLFARLEQEGNTSELAELRANAPEAIPQPPMRKLWRLLLTGRVKSLGHDLELYEWADRLKQDGLTTTLRLQLRELLAPKVVLKKPFSWGESDQSTATPVGLRQLVSWEVVLAADEVQSSLLELSKIEYWRHALPEILEDTQQLLRDALDLRRELDGSDEHSDRSHWDLPSISPHWQNRGFNDWTALIELLRDAWLAVRKIDPEQASRIARGWFALPYPTFKRLALFAASHDGCIAAQQWVDWLGIDGARWLWSVATQREAMRLLVLQGAELSPETRARLETAILAGPPRAMFRDDLEPDRWRSLVDLSIWLRLAKLGEGGSHLGVAASMRFKELSQANPNWRIAAHERDEFPVWSSGSGDPDYEDSRDIDIAPRKRRELLNWLRQPLPSQRLFYEDTWGEVCRTRLFHSLSALCDLARQEAWPAKRWGEALQAWSDERLAPRSWRLAAPLLRSMPDEVLHKIPHPLTWWLEIVSKTLDRHEAIFLELCGRVLALPIENELDTCKPVSQAINHPIGRVTQALLNVWLKRKPNDNETLPSDIEPFFKRLCNCDVERFRHGRVLLASRLIAIFRVDRSWTEVHLLPLFDWAANPVEAKAAWEGFLWSPRLYQPLLVAFKTQFLATAHHYAKLEEYRRQFAAFLTFAALEPVDGYSPIDFQEPIGALPQEGLQEAALTLSEALEGAGEQREYYWRNRIEPFWIQVWPKSRHLASDGIVGSLARLSIAARGEFPSALGAVRDWLRPIARPDYVVRRLHESSLAERFPKDALSLLNAILDGQSRPSRELKPCLAAVAKAAPSLQQDLNYQRLLQLQYCWQGGV